MSTVWVVLALCVAGVVAALISSWRRTDLTSDLGAVSHQWLAEHRLGSGHDSRR
jgi:hypothetical protein